MEGHTKVDDKDESEDEFFVPDGSLSDNEGVEVDEMESDELFQQARNMPECEKQVQSEEFYTLVQRQKYLNNLTQNALKRNQPLIILNLIHEKTAFLPAEELTGKEKIDNDEVDDDLESLSKKQSAASLATAAAAAIPDSDLPQIISIIHSCSQSIGKIVESLQSMFLSPPKSLLRNKVRKICRFFCTFRKEVQEGQNHCFILHKKMLASSGKTMDMSEISPQPSMKHRVDIVAPKQDCSKEHR